MQAKTQNLRLVEEGRSMSRFHHANERIEYALTYFITTVLRQKVLAAGPAAGQAAQAS